MPEEPGVSGEAGGAGESSGSEQLGEATEGDEGGSGDGAQSDDTEGPTITPMTIPPATGNNAVITVKVGSDRVGVSGVTNLAGVTLLLNTGTNSPSGTRPDGIAGTADGWAKCVSDADGDCSFVVPNTGGSIFNPQANRNARYWVIQAGVPDGYYTNPVLRTGGSSSGAQTPYRFRTGEQLTAGNTYTSELNFMYGTSGGSNALSSRGIWQQSRVNPDLSPSCGLNVALILDTSGSVGSDMPNLKTAADTFVTSLQGTPSRMALFSFSTNSPGDNASPNYPDLVSVSTAAQGAAFKNRYASWAIGGGTNWDRGFGTVSSAISPSNSFDLAVIITDGNPTFYSTGDVEGPGNYTRFRELEAGIFSANALKAAGTRVIAFGVGSGATGSMNALNLRAISGETAFNGSNGAAADYYQTSNYQAAGTALRNLALGNCEGNLTVTKQIVPTSAPEGSITGAIPAGAGWTFTASGLTGGATTPDPERTTIGDGTGTVAWPLDFPGGVASANVTVTESQQDGFTLTQVNGQNAVCTNLNTGNPVIPTNQGALGFSVDVPSTDAVNCTVYNRAPNPEVDLTVNKRWIVNGVEYVNGAQPGGISAALTLTGPGAAAATAQGWGVTRGGYDPGSDATINEAVNLIDRELCTNSAAVTEVNGAAANYPLGDDGYPVTLSQQNNTATITNTVECKSTLTLRKQVQGGVADPTDWTLQVFTAGEDGVIASDVETGTQISGAMGTSAVTGVYVAPNTRYQIAETGGDPRYAQTDTRSSLQSNPLSTGSAACIRVNADGTPYAGSAFADGINGGVNVPLGFRVACTLTNQTAQLELFKHVENTHGGTLAAPDWDLTATPDTMTGLSATTLTGSETTTDDTSFQVRPNHTYTLSETTQPGYTFQKLQQCVADDQTDDCNWVDVTADAGGGFPRQDTDGNWQIQVGVLDSPIYRFVNVDDQMATIVIKKIVTSPDAITPNFPFTTENLPDTGAFGGGGAPIAGSDFDFLLGDNDTYTVTLPAADTSGINVTEAIGDTALGWPEVGPDEVEWRALGQPTCSYEGAAAGADRPFVTDVGTVSLSQAMAGGTTLTCTFNNTNQTPSWTTWKYSNPTGGTQSTPTEVLPGGTVIYYLYAQNWSGDTIQNATLVDDLSLATGGVLASAEPVGFADGSVSFVGADGTVATDVMIVDRSGSRAGTGTTVPESDPNVMPMADRGNISFDEGTGKLTWTIPELPPESFLRLSFPVKVNTTAFDALLHNQMNAASDNFEPLECGASPTSSKVRCDTWHDTPIAPKLTLVKQVTNTWGGVAEPEDWTLSATTSTVGAPTLSGASGTSGASGELWPNLSYTLAETNDVDGYEVATNWTCVAASGSGSFTFDGNQSISLGYGADVTCTIGNRDTPGTAEVGKTITSATQGPDGVWTVVYEVVVSNPSDFNTTYTFTDTLRFGDGIDVTSAVWNGPAAIGGGTWNQLPDEMSNTFVTNQPLAKGTSDTYTVTVQATIAEDVWESGTELTCSTATPVGNGGFLNAASVTFPGGSDSDDDCETPTRPTIHKTFDSATQSATDPEQWEVAYTITVTGGEQSTYYDVADVPGFADGADLVSGTATLAGASGSPWTLLESGATAPATWDPFRTSVPIGAGDVHEYTVVWVVDIDQPITGDPQTCSPGEAGRGFYNQAVMTVAGAEIDDEACGPIEELVAPTVEKTVTSTTQGADGNWTIVYDVRVTLPTGDLNPKNLSAEYSLTDTLRFGGGITIVGNPTWSGPNAASGTFAGNQATLATDETITPDDSPHVYTVTAIATVPTEAFTEGSVACSAASAETGAGFLNTTTVESAGVTDFDEDCSQPGAPTLEKSGQVATQNDDGSWSISYLLTVTNPAAPNAPDVVFTLTDTPAALPTGVTLAPSTNWTASAGAGSPEVTQPERPDTGEWTIASDTLKPGSSATYTVSATVVVAILDHDATEAGVTGQCEDTGPWGIILPNGAGVTSGGFAAEDEGCTVVPPAPEVWVAKTVSAVDMDADGVWRVVYDVTATNTDSQQIATYSLSDTLRFGDGIDITSAVWVGPEETPGGANLAGSWDDLPNDTTTQFVTDRPLAPSTVETYTVTVQAAVPAGVWEGEGLQCAAPGSGDNGGFFNEATVTFPGGENTDEDCAVPTRPNVRKVFVSSTQSEDDPEQWQVAYTITVTGEEHDSFYDLADVPGFPDGVDLIAGTASLEGDTESPWNLPTDGTSFRSTVPIAAGEVHEYTVVWTVEIDEPIQGDAATCAPGEDGRGFFNRATMTVAAAEIGDEACGPVAQAVAPTVTKTVTSTVQNPDDTWTVTYNVEVSLPTGELNPNNQSAEYDLVDELRFGESVSISGTPTWVGPGGASGEFSGASAVMATDMAITPDEPVHIYTVTAVAAVGEAAFESGTAYCAFSSGGEGAGFLNRATVESAGVIDQDEDCSQPTAPVPTWTLSKSADVDPGTQVKAGDTITYTLTATNTGKTKLKGAQAVDDLSKVLDAATLQTPLAYGLTQNEDGLTWAIPNLEPGESVRVSYAVKVNPFDSHLKLVNVVAPTTPGGECLPGECSTTHRGGGLPVTGAQVGALVGAVLLLGVGAGAIYASKRRRG